MPVPGSIPTLTEAQMIEVDRLMIDEVGISLLQMMENAGRSLADLTIDRYQPRAVTVLAGSGGNGGGALAAARHLANRGIETSVCISRRPEELTEAAAHQLRALAWCGVDLVDDPPRADVTVDGLIGYSLRGAPRGRTAQLIEATLSSPGPVLALDAPSGVDVTTGAVHDPAIRADATMTLALLKGGLIGHRNVGDLYLADISVPPAVYHRIGLDVPSDLFARGRIIQIQVPA